ncbi:MULTISPECIES: hypothetical protein [unclassified Roseateles]|uniref:hypothetical protein n=1 Tax=unclassified Roseateles TaxID=2626991 RepID=UPI0006FB9DF3|nr:MULTISPECIES: hypothetical protein [unclassified Roseateles]KQW52403.1 hypothetical protein ASC81_05415 [Pelomonas sp. Root405]KRA78636.1 hypothetical protein ASD88_05420 [Pelomonas sp. Root662]
MPPASSRFLTADLARSAISALAPAIQAQLGAPEVSGLGVLHIVVLDPAAPAEGEPRILYERSIGDRDRWDVDYADYARRKAAVCWRHRMDGRRLQLLEPHRLQADDCLLWGGVWLDGLVVAASGAFPIWDECFSLMTAAQLRARAWEAAQGAR